MKVRLDGQSLRVRLSDSEVTQLTNSDAVSVQTPFANGRVLEVRLEIAEVSATNAAFEEQIILVRVPSAVARQWAESDQVGIYSESEGLRIVVEKDLRECRR